MTAPIVLAGWRDMAACAGLNPDLWMPGDDADAEQIADAYAQARRVCARCPVRVTCLRTVMAQESPSARFGLWAGLTPSERTTLHRCRTGQCGHTSPTAHHHDLWELLA